METLEEYEQLAIRLNASNLHLCDVWLEHLRLAFRAAEIAQVAQVEKGPLFFLDSYTMVPKYGIVCRVDGSLYGFGEIKLFEAPDHPMWASPQTVATRLEKEFAVHHSYHSYSMTYSKYYDPPFAAKVKLDYEHHCATAARAAKIEGINK